MAVVVSFRRGRDEGLLGRVHRDGTVTFRGRKHVGLRGLPAECRGLRLDVEAYCEWRALYRAIDPNRVRHAVPRD